MLALVSSNLRWLAASPGLRDRIALAALTLTHVAAFAIMLWSEDDAIARIAFGLAWAAINFALIALLKRPLTSGTVALGLLVLLVLLSRFKHGITQMTANFIDVLLIDRDSVGFLFTIFASLRWYVLAAAIVAVPLLYAAWTIDPLRLRRLTATACMLGCVAMLSALSMTWQEEEWRAYSDDNYLSKFARSATTSAYHFVSYGFMDSASATPDRLRMPLEDSCQPARARPHIVLIHDESSFDIRQAPGIKVPEDYGNHFVSNDGTARKFVAETTGGWSWLTEYNVLTGLSSRTFGRFSYFVTRIAANRVERGLALALRRCGYETMSLYPAYGAFMSARKFQQTTGFQHFHDARSLGAKGVQPDSFFYDAAVNLMAQEKPGTPLFSFVYLAANHFPWDSAFRADLTPGWKNPGNGQLVDEYLRRQQMSATDYRSFVARLKKEFPAQPFLIVRYGDHQPDFAAHLIERNLDQAGIARRLIEHDPRYFTTYYTIDTINFEPSQSDAVMDTIDAPYLPLVIQEAAGLPLDPCFAEQKKIMLRCEGKFFDCQNGAEARRFNRLLIDAGAIKGL
jgi:phosphoglycerol transferase MdoB-like AlkP superfamily enzyme